MIFQWYFKTKVPNFHDNYERFKTEKHRTTYYIWSSHTSYEKIYKVFQPDLMYNISVNKEYVKYIFIYPCSKSRLCLFQNSMIFPWVTDPKFNDFSMIFLFLQISRTFHEIQWFFHDLETDLNFNDFSRAVGTLVLYSSNICEILLYNRQWVVITHELVCGVRAAHR